MGKSAVPKQKRGPRGQQNVGIVDRVQQWMRNNQKVLLVLLLLLIAPIFFVPGAFQSVLSGGGGAPRMKIDGEVVYESEIRSLKETVDGIQGLRRPDFSDRRAFQREFPKWLTLRSVDALELPLLEREAERQGIVVGDPELGAALRGIYRELKVAKESQENSLVKQLEPATPEFNFQERKAELDAQDPWDRREWRTLLRDFSSGGRIIPTNIAQPKPFEKALRRVMRIEKLIGFVMDSVEVDENAVRKEYTRDQQFRKFSFFWLEPSEEEVAKGAEGIEEKDVEEFFDENTEEFRVRQAVGRVDYLYVPFSRFDDKVEISDEDIQKEYEATRGRKFRRGLADENLQTFELRTREEEEAREEKLYKPLAEVRDEVIEALREQKKKRLARKFGRELRGRISPPVGDEEKKVSFDDLVKEHSDLESGTTPMMTNVETRDELGKFYASSIAAAFSTLTKNASQKDESLHSEIKISTVFNETTDKSGLVLYDNFRSRLPGIPKFDDVRDEAREKLSTKRALDGMEAGVNELLKRLREGVVNFESAAEVESATVHPVPFIRRTGSISIAVREDEEKADAAADDDQEPEKKTETVPYQEARALTTEVFSMAVDDSEKKLSFTRDDKSGKYAVLRLEGTLDPDENGYQEWRNQRYDGIAQQRQAAYFRTWKNRLRKARSVQFVVSRSAALPEDPEGNPDAEQPSSQK